mmetsp:Transcript_6364/g.12679  ORF Transcript_6364/g.12679 Transcript_6364/m.12679 type:complete len:301 (-) Transcript_6364:411-1313(-)
MGHPMLIIGLLSWVAPRISGEVNHGLAPLGPAVDSGEDSLALEIRQPKDNPVPSNSNDTLPSRPKTRKELGKQNVISMDVGEDIPKVSPFIKTPAELHVRKEETASSEGLLAEYGLLFLISAGSLSILAASLLGLSVACTSNNWGLCVNREPGDPSGKTKKLKWSRSCTGDAAPKVPKPDPAGGYNNATALEETRVNNVENYSFRALADSFVGSLRSFTGSIPAMQSGLSKKPETRSNNAEDSAWSMYHTEEGIPYYYNALTGKTSWDPPENVMLAESFSSAGTMYSSPPNTCGSNSSLP